MKVTPFIVLVCNKESVPKRHSVAMVNTNGYLFLKWPLLFCNGFLDTPDGRINIEIWYSKIAFDNIFLLVEHEVFLKSKLQITYL